MACQTMVTPSNFLQRNLTGDRLLKRSSANQLIFAKGRSRTLRRQVVKCSAAIKKAVYHNLGGNSWKMELPNTNTTVLCDPWLVGALSFFDQDWLYTGSKKELGLEYAEGADILLLSQGLEDHAHLPTLRALPKSLPVIASPTAAKVAKDLGYTNVITLRPGQNTAIGELEITATSGALVGPPWSQRENGFVLREKTEDGFSWYYEPHCSFDERSVSKVGVVDVVIAPAAEIKLGEYPLVNAGSETVKLLRNLRPKILMPLQNGAIDQAGTLAPFVKSSGSLESLKEYISGSGVNVNVLMPPNIGENAMIEIA